MAGTTYSNLTTDIRNYTEVGSDVLTTAVINRFIEDAEFRIYQELPMDSQRFVQEGTLSTNNNTINNPAGTLFICGVFKVSLAISLPNPKALTKVYSFLSSLYL